MLSDAFSRAAAQVKQEIQAIPGAPGKEIDSPFEFAGGSGTVEDPYLIQTAGQLNAVRKGLKFHYRLIADIDLSGWGNWIPIGGTAAYGFMPGGPNKADKGACAFQGSFDGNGHVVSGMQIVINEKTPFLTESGNWRAYGLFASLATSPDDYRIINLGVVNFNIDVNYTDVKKNLDLYAAAICGGMNNGTDIVNCYSRGGKISINVKGNEAFRRRDRFSFPPHGAPRVNIKVGGICSTGGGVFGNSRKTLMHIERCFNDSYIIADAGNCNFNIYAGGIIASMNTSHIHECYNSGNISLPSGLDNFMGSWTDSMAGGICAFAAIPDIPGIYHKKATSASFIQNCYNSGTVSARAASGIFNYSASDIHLENCYNTGHIEGNEFDNCNGTPTISDVISKAAPVVRYGKEYIRNCSTNGNSVSGDAWRSSSVLGRKVLAAIPEDEHPSTIYDSDPGNIGAFTDVKADAWYADALRRAMDKGIISDTSSTAFSPDKTCTRAQLLTFLWRAAGSPQMSGTNPFQDVKAADEYYNPALWASEMGMVGGGVFSADKPCTRAETVVYLWKSAGSPEDAQANMYLDLGNHGSELIKAVSWAFMNAVMGGTDLNKFSPNKTCTRAQVLTYMDRTIK